MNAEAAPPGPAHAHAPAAVLRVLDLTGRVESAVAIGGLCASALLLLVDIALREGLVPLARLVGLDLGAWLPRGLSRYALYGVLISAFAGFAVSSATRSHLASGLGSLPLPAPLARHRERVGDLLTGLVFATAAGYAARFVWGSYLSGARASFLPWPAWPIQAVLPLALGTSALRYLGFAAWPAPPSDRGPGP